jgi:hypothetical protein
VVRHGGLPERPMGADCKSVAKATEVRILYPPHGAKSAPDLGFPGRGLILLGLARSSRIRPSTAPSGQIVGRSILAVLVDGGRLGRVLGRAGRPLGPTDGVRARGGSVGRARRSGPAAASSGASQSRSWTGAAAGSPDLDGGQPRRLPYRLAAVGSSGYAEHPKGPCRVGARRRCGLPSSVPDRWTVARLR